MLFVIPNPNVLDSLKCSFFRDVRTKILSLHGLNNNDEVIARRLNKFRYERFQGGDKRACMQLEAIDYDEKITPYPFCTENEFNFSFYFHSNATNRDFYIHIANILGKIHINFVIYIISQNLIEFYNVPFPTYLCIHFLTLLLYLISCRYSMEALETEARII